MMHTQFYQELVATPGNQSSETKGKEGEPVAVMELAEVLEPGSSSRGATEHAEGKQGSISTT